MERARATVAAVVPPGSLIITTESVGRPAENIDYYSGVAQSVYLTDLRRWHLGLAEVAYRATQHGMTPYVLLPANVRGELLAELPHLYRAELVADIPPERAVDWFVAAAFHRGIHMELHRIHVPAINLTPKRPFVLPRRQAPRR
jgi:hypothetical protein